MYGAMGLLANTKMSQIDNSDIELTSAAVVVIFSILDWIRYIELYEFYKKPKNYMLYPYIKLMDPNLIDLDRDWKI